jgi:hypothetical protein
MIRFVKWLALAQCCFMYANGQSLYDGNIIQKIEVYFSQSNWDYQLDTARLGTDDYIIADWVKINGTQYDSIGVKYKGNSSYDSTYIKNPLHIELDHIKAQSHQGFTDIKLGNHYADPSGIREVLSYNIISNYMHCPKANFAQLYVNGNYVGLYTNVESINKDFLSTRFNSSSNTFFKCSPMVTPGPTTKSNLRHIPLADSSGYFNFYELKSDYGWNDLVNLCDTVTNYASTIGNMVDMDRVMWMLALNQILVNLDSYTGVFCQNYYLYKDATQRYSAIMWDLNMAFGGFPFVGSGNTSMGSLTIANMQQLSPTFHATDTYWPLINAVMNNVAYKKEFIAHARTILAEHFSNGNYIAAANALQLQIDTAVLSDANNFFAYNQFQNGLTGDVVFGSYTIPGISNLMTGRISYLQTHADFIKVPPTISAVQTTGTPLLNSNLTVIVSVTNATQVYLAYRSGANQPFIRTLMFDDGLHNDGAAADGVFGADLLLQSLQTQYYIYAENTDAGMFSPQRAEHEYYTVTVNINTATAGQVSINEFMADNTNHKKNEYNQFADWIELYNNTNTPLAMHGLYLTDDATNLTKFAFPASVIIPAHDFLILWADEKNSTTSYLHCNFKLSANGEKLILNDGTTVLDSISFGAQQANKTFGRCPNGSGPFQQFTIPTFNAFNCGFAGVVESLNQTLTLFPNPANDVLMFSNYQSSMPYIVQMTNSVGQTILQQAMALNKTLDISQLATGIYFVAVTDLNGKTVHLKFLKN